MEVCCLHLGLWEVDAPVLRSLYETVIQVMVYDKRFLKISAAIMLVSDVFKQRNNPVRCRYLTYLQLKTFAADNPTAKILPLPSAI